jgi:hypothetical protein
MEASRLTALATALPRNVPEREEARVFPRPASPEGDPAMTTRSATCKATSTPKAPTLRPMERDDEDCGGSETIRQFLAGLLKAKEAARPARCLCQICQEIAGTFTVLNLLYDCISSGVNGRIVAQVEAAEAGLSVQQYWQREIKRIGPA